MAKKGAVQQLQAEINTDDELEKFLEKDGLLVMDIYTDWCGPCLGMVGSLKKIKLELGGDDLHLAICRSDDIKVLMRFRNKSEPTWMFASSGKVVNLLFGTNVPKLMKLIATELEIEKKYRAGEVERQFYELTELTPVEQEREATRLAIEEEANRIEREAAIEKRHNFIKQVTDEIMQNAPDIGVMFFMPHVTKDGFKKISPPADELGLVCKDRKTIVLTSDMLEVMNFECENPMDPEVLNYLFGQEIQAHVFKISETDLRPVEEVLTAYLRKITEAQMDSTEEDVDKTEKKLPPILPSVEVKIQVKNDDIENKSTVKVEESLLEVENDEKKSDEKIIIVPGAWTPINKRANSSLIYLFFRNLTENFLPPDPIPEPEHIAIIFDAFKRNDILEVCEQQKDAVLAYGYFSGIHPETAELLANTTDIYQKRKPLLNDKLVLKLAKVTSEPLLAFISFGPCYISQNSVEGQKECLKFFPPGYTNSTGEVTGEEHVEVSKKGRKKKKAKKKDEDTASSVQGASDIAVLEEVADDTGEIGEIEAEKSSTPEETPVDKPVENSDEQKIET